MPQEEYQNQLRHHRRERRSPAHDRTFILRNILNVIFIIGAIVGVIFYIYTDKLTGTFIIMFAMIVKFAESAIRFLHR